MSMQEHKRRKIKEESDEEEEEEFQHDESSGQDVGLAMQKNENGEAFCELGKTKRVTVREFKGKVLVDVREYYEKDGKQLPGKKGISLNKEQYEAFRDLVKDGSIDAEIKKLDK